MVSNLNVTINVYELGGGGLSSPVRPEPVREPRVEREHVRKNRRETPRLPTLPPQNKNGGRVPVRW